MRKILLMVITLSLALFIVYFRVEIEAFLGMPSSANLLLLILIGVDLLAFLSDIIDKRSQRKLEHSRKLVDAVFSKWFTLAKIGRFEIRDGRFIATLPQDPPLNSALVPEAIQHLKTMKPSKKSFPNVWAIWEKAKTESLAEIERVQKVWDQFEEKVKGEITNAGVSLAMWDYGSERPTEFYCFSDVLKYLYIEVEYYLRTKEWLYPSRFNIQPYGEKHRLEWSTATGDLAIGEKSQLECLSSLLKDLLNDRLLWELVKSMKAKEGENIKLFEQELKNIIKNVVELDIPLKGKCSPLGY